MLTALSLLACGAPNPPASDTEAAAEARADTATGADTDTPPTLESRPNAETCGERPLIPEPLSCDPTYPYPSDCTAHADCTDGVAGACIGLGPHDLYCSCAYDACEVDADCASTAVCGCASDVRYQILTNTCLGSNCRTDADCSSGRCQANHGLQCGTYRDDVRPITGWFCATRSDTCAGDEDCDVAAGDRCMHSGSSFACVNLYSIACD